jgi:Domain of unknown function DUF29
MTVITKTLYDTDFNQWLEVQVQLLRHHLLKWQYQPTQRTGSWQGTIAEQRRRIRDLLLDSPSLNGYVETVSNACYTDARDQASLETRLSLDHFPADCPYANDLSSRWRFTDALNLDFWPET